MRRADQGVLLEMTDCPAIGAVKHRGEIGSASWHTQYLGRTGAAGARLFKLARSTSAHRISPAAKKGLQRARGLVENPGMPPSTATVFSADSQLVLLGRVLGAMESGDRPMQAHGYLIAARQAKAELEKLPDQLLREALPRLPACLTELIYAAQADRGLPGPYTSVSPAKHGP